MHINRLSTKCLEICRQKGWARNWSNGGCYLHLEVSEFIDALRGKGDILAEATDVMFVLLSIFEEHDINAEEVLAKLEDLCNEIQDN